jgi:predicted enzyme related to lactoylglutathione lyase
MSSAETRGQFVWHELMTTDTAGAGAFYPRIAGWKTQAWDKDTSYTLWIGNAGPMGGVMSLGGEAAASHWMPYIGTPDVAATVEAAKAFAVLQDPQGAVFAVFRSAMPNGGAPPQARGDFSWHELSTTDFAAALPFYTALFGWEMGPTHDMGELGYYQIFLQGGKQIGGMFNMPPGVTTPHWLSYVRVDDVDEATDAAKAAGGRLINGPMEVPGGDWIAQLLDPQGAVFAVHEVKARRQEPVAKPPKVATALKPARARKEAPKKKRAAAKAKSASAARKRSAKGKSRVVKARKKASVKARPKAAKRTTKNRVVRRSAAARKPKRRVAARRVRAKRRR